MPCTEYLLSINCNEDYAGTNRWSLPTHLDLQFPALSLPVDPRNLARIPPPSTAQELRTSFLSK